MHTTINQSSRIGQLLGMLLGLFLLAGCSINAAPSPTITAVPSVPTEAIALAPTQPPGPWREIGVYTEKHSIMTAGFLDEQHVATGGVIGQMAYSSSGAETWLETDSLSDCRYGIEIVSPDLIWTCGGATQVRKSVDGGKTWEAVAAFGESGKITNPCRSMSFLDENIGWLANSNLFGTTIDGGDSWVMTPLPEKANQIATIDTYLPGEGYLLDKSGVLFFTQDNGLHWHEAGRLPSDMVKMALSVYQLAAMRFSDAEHGLVVVSSGNSSKAGPVTAFHTADGGATWNSEVLSVPTGPVYLSREGGFLTVISAVNQLTLLKYEALN